ncbi:CGNR zinc finger domain-containing protein [Saccharopolyspora taberi]|uniref:CGNR zinc finger domain-containing protein n=1 Tax=Saccharopolyspora taberi TaxID=60895 RepID=A0ABN3VE23_9PSEU
MPPPSGIRWSEHHHVPDDLAVLFDFLNTNDERDFGDFVPHDELTSTDALADWLAGRDLVISGTPATADDFRIALQLREALRVCALSNRTGEPAPDIARLGPELPLHAGIEPGGAITLRAARSGVRGALAALLADAVRASTDGRWARVKMCASDDCRNVFYDHSKPRNARWCSSKDCGNRAKTRSYRLRRQSSVRDR